MELLVAATQNPSLPDKVRSIMWTERSEGVRGSSRSFHFFFFSISLCHQVDGSVIQHQIASLLLQEMKDTSRTEMPITDLASLLKLPLGAKSHSSYRTQTVWQMQMEFFLIE